MVHPRVMLQNILDASQPIAQRREIFRLFMTRMTGSEQNAIIVLKKQLGPNPYEFVARDPHGAVVPWDWISACT